MRHPSLVAFLVLVAASAGGCEAVKAASDAGPADAAEGGGDATAEPDVRVPETCGDGACDPTVGEDCTSCEIDCGSCSVCGDGVTDPGEDCDDGNTLDGDGCTADCRWEAPPGSISYRISGTVTVVDDPGNLFGGAIVVGTLLEGRYVFNPGTPDSNSAVDVGDYWHYDPGYGMSIQVGGWTFATDAVNVEYLVELVNRTQDNIVMHSYQNVSMPVSGVGIISWQLDDPSGSALSSDVLDPAPPALAQWTQPFGLTMDGNIGADYWFVRAVIEYVGP